MTLWALAGWFSILALIFGLLLFSVVKLVIAMIFGDSIEDGDENCGDQGGHPTWRERIEEAERD